MLFLALTDLVWWGVGYGVARLILPLVSFGKLRVAPLDSVGKGFGWLGYRRNDSGHVEIEPILGVVIGLVVCCIGLMVVLYFVH